MTVKKRGIWANDVQVLIKGKNLHFTGMKHNRLEEYFSIQVFNLTICLLVYIQQSSSKVMVEFVIISTTCYFILEISVQLWTVK